MTKQEIRKDLREIKYYYSRINVFESNKLGLFGASVSRKAEKYNKYITDAPARLYDIYVSLYLNNMTQKSLADELGYTVKYVQYLNGQLLDYLLQRSSKY